MEYKWPIISYQIDRKCSSISRVEPLYWFKRESFNGSLHVLLQQTCSLKRCSKAEKLQLIRERKRSRTALTHSVTRQGRLGTKGFSWSRYETRWALNCLRKPFQVNKLVTHSSHWSMENLFEWFEVIDWNIFLFPFEAFKRKKNKGQSCRNAKRVGKLQVPSIGDSISPGTGWVMENGFESYFNWYVSWKVFWTKRSSLLTIWIRAAWFRLSMLILGSNYMELASFDFVWTLHCDSYLQFYWRSLRIIWMNQTAWRNPRLKFSTWKPFELLTKLN